MTDLASFNRGLIIGLCMLNGNDPFRIAKPILPPAFQLVDDELFENLITEGKDMAEKEYARCICEMKRDQKGMLE